MLLNAYLSFDGRCEEAFKFYEKALGGKILAMVPAEGSPVEKHLARIGRRRSFTPASASATRS
jgi:PhnB protein